MFSTDSRNRLKIFVSWQTVNCILPFQLNMTGVNVYGVWGYDLKYHVVYLVGLEVRVISTITADFVEKSL